MKAVEFESVLTPDQTLSVPRMQPQTFRKGRIYAYSF